LIVKAVSYELTDPTIDPQILALKAAGANVLLDASSPKFTAQAIRKIFDIDWRPTHFLSLTGQSIPAALVPAGVEKAVGIISASPNKDSSNSKWDTDKGVQDYVAFMKAYFPDRNPSDLLTSGGYGLGQQIVYLLEQCGDNLSRENVMYQATHIHDVELPMLLPGIKVNTSPSNHRFINQLQLERFDGRRWVPFGEILSE
jgi:branched-chain amino acid transport system substrate-binding protein